MAGRKGAEARGCLARSRIIAGREAHGAGFRTILGRSSKSASEARVVDRHPELAAWNRLAARRRTDVDKVANRQFVTKTEALVKPRDVTAISFLGEFNKILPRSLQAKVMKAGSAKAPYMGFIVDPYCLFLAYAIRDEAAARLLLPEGYDLAEARIFKDQRPVPLAIVGAFSVRASAFTGTRLEIYVTARRRSTGQLCWIIAEYETNTNSYDPMNGFSGYTAEPAVLTTTPHGELVADFRALESCRSFSVSADLQAGRWRELDPEL